MKKQKLIKILLEITDQISFLHEVMDDNKIPIPQNLRDQLDGNQADLQELADSYRPRVVIIWGPGASHRSVPADTIEEATVLAKKYATEISGWQQIHSTSVWLPHGQEPKVIFRGGWKNDKSTH